MSESPIDGLPFATHMNLRFVEIIDGRAVVECATGPQHANSRGVIHGGVVSSLIDTAAGASIAYQPSVNGRAVATVSLTTNFIRAGQVGDTLRAVGRRRGGHQIITCDVEVYNQDDQLVAFGVATMTVL